MIDPAVLDALLEAGATAEMIVAAVKADMRKDELRREKNRANNAERQQRFRDKRASRKSNGRNALRDVTPPIEEIITPSPDISSDEESQSDERDDCATVVAAWNSMAAANDLPICAKLSPARRKACKARLRDDGLDAIRMAIERIPKSAFLLGQAGNWSGANINFLFRPDTVTKILEGQYDDRQKSRSFSNAAPPDRRDGIAQALDRRLGLDEPAGQAGRSDFGDSQGDSGGPAPRLAALR